MNKCKKIYIEIFEEHEKVNFYSIRFDNENECEANIFFEDVYKLCEESQDEQIAEDIQIISKLIDKIGEKGAKQKYFRNAGKKHDNVGALPEYIYTGTKLRLYAIRLTEQIVILGNGGIKTTRTYNEDPNLLEKVELLQNIDAIIKSRMKMSKLYDLEKKIYGRLVFYLK